MDYNIELTHEFAVGSLNEVISGCCIPKTFDIDDAISSLTASSGSLILAPKIIGVYMRMGITLIQDGQAADEDSESCIETRVDYGDNLGFDVHPALVQIGYDPQVLKAGIISDFIGEQRSRIRIVPYGKLETDNEELKQYADLCAKRLASLDCDITNDDLDLAGRLTKQILVSHGLTMPEYNLMQDFLV